MRRTFGSRLETKGEGFLRPIFFPALAFADSPTGDGRILEAAGGGVRDLPLTIWGQFVQESGHTGSVIVGALHEVTFHEDGVVSGSGWALDDENGRQAVIYLQTQAMRGNSVDLADVTAHYEWDEGSGDVMVRFEEWNIAGTTLVGRPAFKDARASLEEELVASWMASDEPLVVGELPTTYRVVVAEPELAADAAKRPSWDMFNVPEADTPMKVTVGEADSEGFIPVFGHPCLWNSCHDAFEAQCLMPPRPSDGFASFNTPGVLTDKGMVNTGPLFFRGGHPRAGELRKVGVEKAYGDVENAWADVRVTVGAHGPWLSGYVRPGTPDDTIVAARASKVSGHWLGDRLMAICSVNVPGYNVPGAESFSLSADGTVDELVASFDPGCDDGSDTSDEAAAETSDETTEFDIDDLALAMARQDLVDAD